MEQQRTLEWYRKRIGKWNGSEIGSLMVESKKKDEVFGKGAITYIYKVAGERSLNPKVIDDDTMFEQYLDMVSFSNKFTNWGADMEGLAKKKIANELLVSIEEVGSCIHPIIKNYAASPDGICYEDGHKMCVEIKSPKVETYMRYKTELKDWDSLKRINPDYYWQSNSEIDCTESDGIFFCLFNPFVKEPLYYVKLMKNPVAIQEIHGRIELAEEYIKSIL